MKRFFARGRCVSNFQRYCSGLAGDGADAHREVSMSGVSDPVAPTTNSVVSLQDVMGETLATWGNESSAYGESLRRAGVVRSDISLGQTTAHMRQLVQSIVRVSIEDTNSAMSCAADAATLHASSLRPTAQVEIVNEHWTHIYSPRWRRGAVDTALATHAIVVEEEYMHVTTHVFHENSDKLVLWVSFVMKLV